MVWTAEEEEAAVRQSERRRPRSSKRFEAATRTRLRPKKAADVDRVAEVAIGRLAAPDEVEVQAGDVSVQNHVHVLVQGRDRELNRVLDRGIVTDTENTINIITSHIRSVRLEVEAKVAAARREKRKSPKIVEIVNEIIVVKSRDLDLETEIEIKKSDTIQGQDLVRIEPN